MKNLMTTLIASVTICALNPAFAMQSEDTDQQKQILACKPYKIPKYETSLTCTSCFTGRLKFTEINFEIKNLNEEKIGEILTQYYPIGSQYYETATEPVVRLRYIEINEDHRRQYNGTRSMETLIIALRKSPALPKSTEMWLEYSAWEPHLKTFYESFGFQETNAPSACETRIMKVKLAETKFPYFSKHKPKK